MAFTRHKVTQMNLGGRYNFTVYGRKSSLRVQIQNILATNEWTSQYAPGFFQWPAPRTVFAYITTDLQ
jgi:iron complex outermembrane recepter protein